MRAPTLLCLAALLVGTSSCSRKSDEQILRRKLDSTAVHLYLAAKIALGPASDKAPEVQRARENILRLVVAAFGDRAPTESGGAKEVAIKARDAADVAIALWHLKQLGKEALAADRDDHPAPFLPMVLPLVYAPSAAFATGIDANTEHALLLAALTLVRAHPKLPVPVAPEIILYEAWHTRPDSLGTLRALSIEVAALRAHAFASNELCDLAGKELEAIERVPRGDSASMALGLALFGTSISMPPRDAEVLHVAARGLANGETAGCYFLRDEPEKAHPPLARLLDSAQRLGIDIPEAEFLRAYLDCAGDQVAAGKKRLVPLMALQGDHAALGEAAKVLDGLCGNVSGSKLAGALDRAMLARALALIAADAVRRSGVVEKLEASPVVRTARGFGEAVAQSAASVRDSVPSARELKEKARSLVGSASPAAPASAKSGE